MPNVEKSTMKNAINLFSKNDTNFIFLNNDTNSKKKMIENFKSMIDQ